MNEKTLLADTKEEMLAKVRFGAINIRAKAYRSLVCLQLHDIKLGFTYRTKNRFCYLTEAHMKLLDISPEELLEAAVANTKADGFEFKAVMPIVKEMFGEFADEYPLPLYYATNRSNEEGASVILIPEWMEQISQKMSGDYYIIPSSVHEVIILPVIAEDINVLTKIVREINKEVVAPKDRLSNTVYRYDSKIKEIVVA